MPAVVVHSEHTEGAPAADNSAVPAPAKPRTTTIGGREYADWNYEKDGTTPVNAEAADAGAPNSVPESMLAQWDREGGREALLYQARSKAESILAAAGR